MNLSKLPLIVIDAEKLGEFNQYIGQLNSSYKFGDELEIRIHPSVKYEELNSLLTYLRQSADAKELPKELSFVKSFRNVAQRKNFREMINVTTNTHIYQEKYQKKFAILETYPYGIKVALSRETTFKDGDKILNQNLYSDFLSAEQTDYQKHQLRYKFNFKNEYEVHLSIISQNKNLDVKSPTYESDIVNSGNLKYEVEIESIKDYFVKNNNYIQTFKFIMNIMTTRLSVMSVVNKDQIIEETNQLICDSHKKHNIKIVGKCDADYKEYKKNNNIFDNKPHSLYYDNVNELLSSKYAVTNKLDGVYFNLFITENFVVIVNSVNMEYLVGKNSANMINIKKELGLSKNNYHILVGELWNNTFNIFDAIVVNGEFVADKDHTVRLEDVAKISSTLSKYTIPIKVKKFFYSGSLSSNLLEDVRKTIKYMSDTYGENYQQFNDGIIFTEVYKGFMAKTLKWKFPQKISIDAKLQEISSTPMKKEFAMLFSKDKKVLPLDNPVFLEIEKGDDLFEIVRENMIVEISWDNGFKADRIRYDKSFPNYYTIAEKTIREMKNPMTLEKLENILEKGEVSVDDRIDAREEDQSKPFRNYCNIVKNILLKKTIKEGANIIDLGAGFGGDLYKYKELKPNNLFLVEPDKTHYDGMKGRINQIGKHDAQFEKAIKPIKAGAEDTNTIKTEIRKTGFSEGITNINMMFSLTFFANEKMNELLKTLDLLENNGTFLCIYMDGDKTLDLLKKNNGMIEKSFYKIEDLSPEKTKNRNYKLGFDHKIKFSFKGVTVTEEGQIEYLVPIDVLNKELKKIPLGLTFSSSSFIDNPDKIDSNDQGLLSQLKSLFTTLNDDEKELLSLYRFNIYKKTEYKAVEQQKREKILKLNIIDVDDQEKIDLTFQKEDEIFYRIGVIGDGSCFVHSLLLTIFQDLYMQLTNDEREKFAKSVRNKVADSIDLQSWLELGNGSVALRILQENIRSLLTRKEQIEYDKVYRLVENEKPENFTSSLLEKIDENFPNLNMFEEDGLVEKSYNKYISNLKNLNFWIKDDYIECFSIFFNLNIIIIKDIDRNVFNYADYKNDRQSVMIFNIDPVHFEALAYEKDEEVSFIFNPDNELVNRLFVREQNRDIDEYEEKNEIIPEITSISINTDKSSEEIQEIQEIQEYEEDMNDVKNKITDIVNDYFLFAKSDIKFEII